MNFKRALYWTALAVTGLAAVGLKIWALTLWTAQGNGGWWGPGHFAGPFGFGPPPFLIPFALLLVVGLVVWYRRKTGFPGVADAWEALGMEYVEGRITREEFLARRAVLEEHRWK